MLAVIEFAITTALIAGAPLSDPFEFFSPSLMVSRQERERLEAGEAVSRVLPSSGRQATVFAAVPVNVSGERLVAWVRDIRHLKESSFVPVSRRFSDPPRLDDLADLMLDDRDLNAIRSCRPGNCGVKLAKSEIQRLQDAITSAGDNWKAVVQDSFRHLVLSRVQAYLAEGHPGLPAMNDHEPPVSLGVQFSSIVQRWDFLTLRMPGLVDYLDQYPRAAPSDIESFLYWSKEQVGGKPVVAVTHVAIVRGGGEGFPDVLVAGKQVFATHYIDASLGITALVRDAQSRGYLVYLNRSEIDVLGGFWGGLIRKIFEGRLKADAPAILRGLRNRLESGEPPNVRCAWPGYDSQSGLDRCTLDAGLRGQ